MKIQRVAMAMIIVFLTFYLLHLGQTLLLPLVIAGAIAYLISILAHAITKLAYKGFFVPKPLAMFVAIAIILLSLSYLVQLITVNIQSVIKVAPDYQQNLEALFFKAYSVAKLAVGSNGVLIIYYRCHHRHSNNISIRSLSKIAV
mgnify:CR=1 FL=1